jgi:hypothetical protein
MQKLSEHSDEQRVEVLQLKLKSKSLIISDENINQVL